MKKEKLREEYIQTTFLFLFLFFIDLLFSYNIKIRVNEYVKLKLPKMNL